MTALLLTLSSGFYQMSIYLCVRVAGVCESQARHTHRRRGQKRPATKTNSWKSKSTVWQHFAFPKLQYNAAFCFLKIMFVSLTKQQSSIHGGYLYFTPWQAAQHAWQHIERKFPFGVKTDILNLQPSAVCTVYGLVYMIFWWLDQGQAFLRLK